MTNPTSNFGWQMPTSTDLVTDLPADFAVFGQAVDTSMADLKGGTTGQILSKATSTDMDFTWITNDVGDITAVNTTAPLQGGATSGAVTLSVDAGTTLAAGVVQLTDSTSSTSTTTAATPNSVKTSYDLANAAIAKSTLTTAGDVLYRNATVPTRLGIGTANQVLRVNSGATAPEWATISSGGMTLLATTTLTGGSVTITGLSTYKELWFVIRNAYVASTGYMEFRLNSDSGSNYSQQFVKVAVTAVTSTGGQTAVTTAFAGYIGDSATTTNRLGGIIRVSAADQTSGVSYTVNTGFNDGTGNTATWVNGRYFNAAVISSIQLFAGASTFSGGTLMTYGVN